MFKEITKDNWLLYAQQNYDNPIVNKEVEGVRPYPVEILPSIPTTGLKSQLNP